MGVTINIGHGHSGNVDRLFISRLRKDFWPRLGKAFRKAGSILEGQIKDNLSGPGRSAGASKRARKLFKERAPFSRLHNFPGVVSGRLHQSVRFKVQGFRNSLTLRVGPNRVYAAIHEFGGMTGRGHKTPIPARPYVWPAYKKQRRAVVRVIGRELMRA